ncbi:Uncharacterized protein BP5553_01837 [Venustampulla echinocandica]|uniref:Uncharacterized protein n=1 Tax=Venustampulla echinocandica TaxID=2656787 RepID=A0A370U258_9HELO|nr:Uncharacterized protein BP5553_01837 [Venustampulla echinocandica]RDL41858.1 Uncharacterized protein BP5553_01837 [Venustampulla echinocandica]
MAPDLNSVPPSPRPLASSPRLRSRTTSRRASQQAIPPASPSLNVLPSNQSTVSHTTTSPPLASPNMAGTSTITGGFLAGDNTGVGAGPGPLRHPQPLTAADLHLQLEKEQEAVVNRLTRELSMLRAAQNASVVSNTSSTSAGLPDNADHNANHLLSGPNHPVPSQRRHHRTSSSTSTRSVTAGINTVGGITSTADRTRGSIPRHDSIPQPSSQSLSRQNSTTGSRRSGTSSPTLLNSTQSSYHHPDQFPYHYHQHQQRPSLSQYREPSYSSSSNIPGLLNSTSESITSVPTTGRYEETAYHRHELEAVKRENEALKRRIRELELTLRARRQSDASRTRSESVSTTASVREPANRRGRERATDEEDGVRVGESARSAGVPR